MANDAFFWVAGFVATQPKEGNLKDGTPTLSMRVGWTPRALDRQTGEWSDRESSFISVTCYRKVAEHASRCVRRGDAVVVKGTLRVREYDDQAGVRRNYVEVSADSLGHDMSRGTSQYTKGPRHVEQTAHEYQMTQAAERSPLPGDILAASSDGDDPAQARHLAAVSAAGDGAPGLADLDDLGLAEQAEPDLDEADPDAETDPDLDDEPDLAELESRDRDAEPVGALA